jgi:hypothetical protein
MTPMFERIVECLESLETLRIMARTKPADSADVEWVAEWMKADYRNPGQLLNELRKQEADDATEAFPGELTYLRAVLRRAKQNGGYLGMKIIPMKEN